jgi:hypothetical protein
MMASTSHRIELEQSIKKRNETVNAEQQRIARDVHDADPLSDGPSGCSFSLHRDQEHLPRFLGVRGDGQYLRAVAVPTRGGIYAEIPARVTALIEAFRGDVFVSVRFEADGRLARVHARDASWFQWPVLEAAIEGNIVADFPLCNKSFNCSYSGHDL